MTPRLLNYAILALLIASVDACMRVTPSEPGMPATPVCKRCAKNLIAVTETGAGAKPMESDVINDDGNCRIRTFTCIGVNPNIEINGGEGIVQGNGQVATFVVECNAAGNGWTNQGAAVTEVTCASD